MGFLSRLFGKGGSGILGSSGMDPRWASQEPILVADIPEEYHWMKAHPCECGGDWTILLQSVGRWPGAPAHLKYDVIETSCESCARRANFHFLVDTHSPQYLAGQEAAMKDLLGDNPSNPGRRN